MNIKEMYWAFKFEEFKTAMIVLGITAFIWLIWLVYEWVQVRRKNER